MFTYSKCDRDICQFMTKTCRIHFWLTIFLYHQNQWWFCLDLGTFIINAYLTSKSWMWRECFFSGYCSKKQSAGREIFIIWGFLPDCYIAKRPSAGPLKSGTARPIPSSLSNFWGNIIKNKISCQSNKPIHKIKEQSSFITEEALYQTAMCIAGNLLKRL